MGRCDVLLFVSQLPCREQNRRFRGREAGGAARQADGAAKAGSGMYDCLRFEGD
jgi:hypothetical protein